MTRRRLLALEPYYGGSHQAVLDGLLARLEPLGWDADLLTLPARKWKWRMRGAAITMADEARRLHGERVATRGSERCWDLVYASTFVNLAELYGMAGEALVGVPSIVYFHENQLLYPNRHTAEWDFQFPLTNITSALAATRCLFNSQYNLDGFLAELGPFLKAFPDHIPKGVAERVAAKSSVVPPPIDPTFFSGHATSRSEKSRIVWPHRWEHDKDPETFFAAVAALAEAGLDFEVVVAGQTFADVPPCIEAASDVLGERVVHCREPASREEYASLLASSDIAVSTAQNEFFGVAMMEAAYAGCYPLVPDRLAYRELYPPEMRFRSAEELVAKLGALLMDRPQPGEARPIAEAHTWERLLPAYAEAFDATASGA